MHRLADSNRIVGTKQTIKHIEKNLVKLVYIADDAETRVTGRVKDLALSKNIPIVSVENMKQLGEACNVEVKTAVAAILKEEV